MKQTLLISITIFIFLACTGCQESIIPVTTDSQEALDLFLQGRDLIDKLRIAESYSYFEQATEIDTNFAIAYLNMAVAASNAVDRLKYIEKAKSNMHPASQGERLIILGFYAAFMGQPGKQREYYEELVSIYPEDARAHTLLGNLYFGNQEYDLAINQYKLASKLDPDFTQPYNQIGYAFRFLGEYKKAESAFKKYVTLIPDDPNPYDSYAELLLEMGEYDVSIENYEKAIKLNPVFSNSYIGIATNLNLTGEHGLARKKLKELFYEVEDIGTRRQALGAMVISYVDEGKYDLALKILDKRLAISADGADTLAMAGDNNFIGVVLREMGNVDGSEKYFTEMIRLVRESHNPEDVKRFWERILCYQETRLAIDRGEFENGWTHQKKYFESATHAGSIFQIRASHELGGMIFYRENRIDESIAEFEKSNLQNPYNLYRLGLAWEAKDDYKTAAEYYDRSANANSFNNLNYSFIRKRV